MSLESRRIKFIPPSRYENRTGRIVGEEKLKNTDYTVCYIELDDPQNEDEKLVASLLNYIQFLPNVGSDESSAKLISNFKHRY